LLFPEKESPWTEMAARVGSVRRLDSSAYAAVGKLSIEPRHGAGRESLKAPSTD